MNVGRFIRFTVLLFLVTSITVLAGICWAKEKRQNNDDTLNSKESSRVAKMKEISESTIEIDENAPMKIAVDNHMERKQAEEEIQKRTDQVAPKEVEGAQRGQITLVVPKQKDNEKIADSSAGDDFKEGNELKQIRAEQILISLIAKNPILQGATVIVKDCPYNWQGCTYYKTGEIWIDPDHTAPLEKIMIHEVNHIIDWRSDGDIDNNDYHQ